MIELKAYRHKTMKDLYLVRTSMCGGGPNTEFYKVAENVLDAIRNYNAYKDDFMGWYHSFPSNKAKATFTKEMEFDGYKGTLKKEMWIPVSEFELVTFVERVEE